MPTDDSPKKHSLAVMILAKTSGPLLTWVKPENPPLLGPGYAAELRKLNERRLALREEMMRWILAQPKTELTARFNSNGAAIENDAKAWQLNERQRVEQFLKYMSPLHAAGLGAPDLMADFDHWSRSAFFELDEALWLSCGMEPTAIFLGERIAAPTKIAASQPAHLFAARRRELLRRQFDPNGYERRISPNELHAWVIETSLETHPGFAEMLSINLARQPVPNDDQSRMVDGVAGVEPKLDNREKRSLATLLVAMAIDNYGYDPLALRGPFPKEIQGIAAQLGLDISQVTCSPENSSIWG